MNIEKSSVRDYNVGSSDYSQHKIQPWDIWISFKLNPFDADIFKRVVRKKSTDPRELDYQKIKHICLERVRQINEYDPWKNEIPYSKEYTLNDIYGNWELENIDKEIIKELLYNYNRLDCYNTIIGMIDDRS